MYFSFVRMEATVVVPHFDFPAGVGDATAFGIFADAHLPKEDGPHQLLLLGIQVGNGLEQPLVVFGGEDIPYYILVRGKKGIVLVVGIQRAVAAGLLVVDVVHLPVQIDQDRPPIIGDLYLDSAGDELILDFHFVSFPPGDGRAGTQKWPGRISPGPCTAKMGAQDQGC